MKKIVVVLILLSSYLEVNASPVLVEKNNFSKYMGMVVHCFGSSAEYKGKFVDYSKVTDLINSKIENSKEIPVISCSGLIKEYAEAE